MYLSLTFWAAFAIFIVVYALLKKGCKAGMMLWSILAGLGFMYLAGKWYMLILPAVTLSTWLFGKSIRYTFGKERKWTLAIGILLSLAPLAYFKYSGFAVDTLNSILRSNFAIGKIALPAGLSFYTFQSVSYLMDVYRKKLDRDVTLLEYAFYQTFFPVLLCGPITRSTVFFPQVEKLKEKTSKEAIWLGLFLFISGMIKKGGFADYLSQYTNLVFDNPTGYSGFEDLMGVLGYTFQIYLDFSGYSDMSIGIASVMGFTLPDNFNYPYKSLNVAEFWHRWHISLSTWFRDYLYIPMGGSRRGKFRTYFNNFFTMLVSGLWHGASWMFVIWGALHGVGLVVSKLFKPLTDKIGHHWSVKALRWAICFVFVSAAWVVFRAPDLKCCGDIFTQILTNTSMDYFLPFVKVRGLWCGIMAACIVFSLTPSSWLQWCKKLFVRMPWILRLAIFALTIQFILWLNQGYVAPMIYASF